MAVVASSSDTTSWLSFSMRKELRFSAVSNISCSGKLLAFSEPNFNVAGTCWDSHFPAVIYKGLAECPEVHRKEGTMAWPLTSEKQNLRSCQFKTLPLCLLGQILQRRCGSTWPLLVTNMSFPVKCGQFFEATYIFFVLFPCIVSFFFPIHSCPGILSLNKALVYKPWSRDVF